MTTSIIDGFKIYVRTELGLSQDTILAYTRDIKEFLDFIRTQELTAQTIETFINYLQKQGLKPTTVRRKCMSIRCLCHHLISLGRLDPNTLNMIDSIRTERRMYGSLDSQVVDILVATVEKRLPVCRATNVRRDVAIILTLYHSGLRVSELCNLNMGDINFARREIKVKGKGGRDRIVLTTQKCIEAIRTYLGWRDNYHKRLDDKGWFQQAVFVKDDGQRLTRRAVSGMILSLSHKAGVEHTTAHVLRRSCATSLMNNGMDLELVQFMLGHESLATTQEYLYISFERLKNIHAKYHPFGAKYVKDDYC